MSELTKLVGITMFGCAALAAVAPQLRGAMTGEPPPSVAAAAQPVAPSPPAATPGNTAILYADARGHFIADIQVRGIPVRALVDTGATLVSFSAEDAAKFGLRAEPNQRRAQFSTANGVVTAAITRVPEMRLQGITVYDVEAAIMPPGAMQGTLLGMSFMKKLQSYESRGTSMVMRR
jgi:aspartyl protease family protein